jgi:hypothetical protein
MMSGASMIAGKSLSSGGSVVIAEGSGWAAAEKHSVEEKAAIWRKVEKPGFVIVATLCSILWPPL